MHVDTFYKCVDQVAMTLGGTAIGVATAMFSREERHTTFPIVLLLEGIALVAIPIISRLCCNRVTGSTQQVHTVTVLSPTSASAPAAAAASAGAGSSEATRNKPSESAGNGSQSDTLDTRTARVAHTLSSPGSSASAIQLPHVAMVTPYTWGF